MPIVYVRGDLLESNADFVCHGCNAVGGFGSGVAGQIARKFPRARSAYIERHKTLGHVLGDVQFVYQFDRGGKYIVNCITQHNYLPRGICHANYEAIDTCMRKVKAYAGERSIALPKIGCGLAGGSWDVVEKILNKVFEDRDVFVYSLEDDQPQSK